MKVTLFSLGLLTLSALVAFEMHRSEVFDTSGMPRRPTNFVEQQIAEMIGSHKSGDLADAARIQRKLGRYYADKGDDTRANAAFQLAAVAEDAVEGRNNDNRESHQAGAPEIQEPRREARSEISRPEAAPVPKIAGSHFGFDGRTLHTWEFNRDGSFLHTWIVSGAGTGIRNSERGTYRLAGESLELKLTSSASAFTTPGVGGRSTLSGGGAGTASEKRQLKVEHLTSENAILLDGVKLKPKSW